MITFYPRKCQSANAYSTPLLLERATINTKGSPDHGIDNQQTEDYLTNKVSGITVMDIKYLEYPDAKEVLYIEGELDYYVFIKADET